MFVAGDIWQQIRGLLYQYMYYEQDYQWKLVHFPLDG